MNFPTRVIQDCTNVVHYDRITQLTCHSFHQLGSSIFSRRQLPVVRCHDQGFVNIMQYTTNFWFRINTCFIFECALQLWVQRIDKTSGINTKWGIQVWTRRGSFKKLVARRTPFNLSFAIVTKCDRTSTKISGSCCSHISNICQRARSVPLLAYDTLLILPSVKPAAWTSTLVAHIVDVIMLR